MLIMMFFLKTCQLEILSCVLQPFEAFFCVCEREGRVCAFSLVSSL